MKRIKVMKPLWIVIICFGLTSCQELIDFTIKRQMNQQLEQTSSFRDGRLHVVLVGTGGPISNKDRISTSIAVLAGEEFILVDAGPGVVRNMGLQGLPLGGLTAVFLTHFHSDHISDLGELAFMSWAQGRIKEPLAVYGPEGVEQVVRGYNMAYAMDSSYRVAHHGDDIMPAVAAGCKAFMVNASHPQEAVSVFNRNGLHVTAFRVNHDPAAPAVGYRFEYKGKVVVVTGDTKKIAALPLHAQSADLLISEALDAKLVSSMSRIARETKQLRLSKLLHDIQDYHMTPIQAAEVAQEAGAKKLVFVHIVPPLINFVAERSFLSGVDDVYKGDVLLGEDGMRFEFASGH